MSLVSAQAWPRCGSLLLGLSTQLDRAWEPVAMLTLFLPGVLAMGGPPCKENSAFG